MSMHVLPILIPGCRPNGRVAFVNLNNGIVMKMVFYL
jgi:hypothetical protein